MQSLTLSRRAAANGQRASKFDRAMTLAIPALIASLAAGAAFAGADTTFDPALTQFTTSSKARAAKSSRSSASRAA